MIGRALFFCLCPALLGGCNLLLEDWQVAALAASASSSSAGTGGHGGAGGSAGGGGGSAPADPLRREDLGSDVLVDGMALQRDGIFRIELGPITEWQWSRWFYLQDAAIADIPLGPPSEWVSSGSLWRTPCLWSATRGRAASDPEGYNFISYEGPSAPTTPADDPLLDGEALPVWFTVSVTINHTWGVTVDFRSRVFASGRVAGWVRVNNDSYTVQGVDIHHGNITLHLDEFDPVSPDVVGLIPGKPGIEAGVLTVDMEPDRGAQWFVPTDGIQPYGRVGGWKFVNVDLAVGTTFEARNTFFLGTSQLLAAERDARTADLQSPGLEPGAGATAPFSSFGGLDPQTGTYVIQKETAASSVVFALAGDLARHEPAFEVQGWTSSTWTIRLGEQVLASSDAGGPDLLAARSPTKLSFQYLRVIPAGASAADRTFTVSEN
jgi:hypothetical protein